MSNAGSGPVVRLMAPTGPEVSVTALDVVVGALATAVGATAGATRGVRGRAAAALSLATRPPGVPDRFTPAGAGRRVVGRFARVGTDVREALRVELSARLDALVPLVAEELLRRAALTELVLRHVDLDRVVAAVDLDAAAARLDVDRVVARADLDTAVSRVDVEAVVDRVDLDAVAARLDVGAVVDRVDLDAVAARLDVGAVVDRVDVAGVVERLDLTALVLEHVDLEALVAAVLDKVDLDQVVGIAETVVDAIDLPDIIRDSSGAMATDSVRSARLRGMAADDAIGRVRDRVFRSR